MAFYIEDTDIINLSLTDEGVKCICEWIYLHCGEYPEVDRTFSYAPGSTVSKLESLVFTLSCYINGVKNKKYKTSSVGINLGNNGKYSMYVNPTTNKQLENITIELYTFILSLKMSVRQSKINKILNEKEDISI